MKILLSWLEEFVDTGQRSPEIIAVDLESLGHEVESITRIPLRNVVVGEITALTKHPNAERLYVAQVSIGERTIQLIFGQYFPVKVGDRLPVAVAPSHLPTGLIVETRTIRGVQSAGMLTADGELGRMLTAEGILRFDTTIKPGTPVTDLIDWRETIFDLSLTPNRGDVFSLRGVARELAAKWQTILRLPAVDLTSLKGETLSSTMKSEEARTPARLAQIEDLDLCPRYSARLISKLTINHAPTVIAGRLTMLGHGQYNSVVDITNYVMEEFGVPLHAFDAENISLPLVIRRAKTGETIQLLDRQTYHLDDSMLVIADQTRPVALAGIMGGLEAAVTDQTTTILLEAAYFEPASIRRTRTKLKILSDAAYRFERGTDPAALELASNRAAALISQTTPVQVGDLEMSGAVPARAPIPFEADKIDAYLETNLGREKIAALLGRFEFDLKDATISVPSWRHDCAIWQDLAEEVARLIGYDQLSRKALPDWQMPPTPDDSLYLTIEAFKDYLVKAGWTEHIGSSFLSPSDLRLLGLQVKQVIALANPVSQEAAYLRSTQLISLLKAIAKNPVFTNLNFFEIGTVWKIETEDSAGEQTALTLAWTGTKPRKFDFSHKQFGTPVDQRILAKLKIRRPIMLSEVPIHLVLKDFTQQLEPQMQPTHQMTFQTPSRFQPVLRDLAIVIDQSVKPADVTTVLRDIHNLVDVELFDQFRGAQLPAGKQSLAFHLLLENPDQSLTSQEIRATMKQVEERLATLYQAEIR